MLKYQKVVSEMIEAIESGIMRSGDRLPSIREYSRKHGISKATIIRAYDELEAQHHIYSIPQSGFYVAHSMQKKITPDETFDFLTVGLDKRVIPYQGFMHSMNQAINLYSSSLFDYDKPEGLESLRNALVNFFTVQDIHTKSELIVITSGAQQGLHLIMSAIARRCNFDEPLLAVEQPTYRMIHQMAEINNVSLIGIERNEKGINFIQMEEVFKKVDYFYTVPRFQNPMGVSYTEAEKKRLLRMAEKYGVIIIEDDYLADLEISKAALPIHYYDTKGHVIYVKSFSKGFMPGIRLGCIVFPDNTSLKDNVIDLKYAHDFCAPVYTQGGLEIFVTSGMYKRHLKKVKQVYREKMKKLIAYINTNKPENVIFHPSRTGIFIWFRVENVHRNLIECLSKKNVFVMPDYCFYMGNHKLNNYEVEFRLCIGPMSDEEIFKGLGIIFQTIKEREVKR
jgi:DNA-binding transcriptional MocR family regulator